MTVYNMNLGIGWASSGVEYAQAYRAQMFRNEKIKAKFIFVDMIVHEHIEHMTRNIGLEDKEVIWMPLYFTDFKIAPVSYTLGDFEKSLSWSAYDKVREDKKVRFTIPGREIFMVAYLTDKDSDLVHRVEYVSRGCLIRKDYFSYGRMFTEYYAPRDGVAYLYQRVFYNVDGSVAYEEEKDGDHTLYRFPDRMFDSREELIGYFLRCLELKRNDVLIIDRSTGTAQACFENKGKAKLGVVIHADHFSESSTDDETILWNNYYDYVFVNSDKVDFFVTATDCQRNLMAQQFKKYWNREVFVATIPVGSLDRLRYPRKGRRETAMVTACRLAAEKHVDWAVRAVIQAHETIPGISLDIYGEGKERKKIEELIEEAGASEYIHLCGHKDMTELYQYYGCYLSGSTSEGFGLSLMEAIGSGLPIIGFDVRYGNPTFVEDGKNGYLIPKNKNSKSQELIKAMADRIICYYTEADKESFHKASYRRAEEFLTENVQRKWKELVGGLK